MHNIVIFISFVVFPFKCLRSVKEGWILIGCQSFYHSSAGRKSFGKRLQQYNLSVLLSLYFYFEELLFTFNWDYCTFT